MECCGCSTLSVHQVEVAQTGVFYRSITFRHETPTQYSGKSKVAELDDLVFRDKNVLWFNISVNALQQSETMQLVTE